MLALLKSPVHLTARTLWMALGAAVAVELLVAGVLLLAGIRLPLWLLAVL